MNRAGRKRGGDRWRGKHVTVSHCHPLVRELFALLNQHATGIKEVSKRSGVHFDTIRHWRHLYQPNLCNFDAVLNSFGYKLKIVRDDA